MEAKISGILFTSKFDSGNLARVERVNPDGEEGSTRVGDAAALPNWEFNLWTKPDCDGTEFQNGNRSWFHFAVKGCPMNRLIKFNIMNMNRQGKLYNQGMSPVVKVLPQKPSWERIRDRPMCETVDGQFIMSFTYRFEYRFSTVYFAFCYPYSYTECQTKLQELDNQFKDCDNTDSRSPDSIYYHRELLCKSLDALRVDLITISSCHGITKEREPRLEKLFPENGTLRAFKFDSKPVYFLSSRVHPGETPASFVFNGFLDFILRLKDPRSRQLRRQFVFKLIPILNPDGVQRGHYRTDQRGVNLNRMYTNPDFRLHPSVFAAKSVVLHHHQNSRVADRSDEIIKIVSEMNLEEEHGLSGNAKTSRGCKRLLVGTASPQGPVKQSSSAQKLNTVVAAGSQELQQSGSNLSVVQVDEPSSKNIDKSSSNDEGLSNEENNTNMDRLITGKSLEGLNSNNSNSNEGIQQSGIAFYVDLHGHASKRGCFMYGNHLKNAEKQVENLLFPKLISLNSSHFDFDGCNFSEKNMYSKDKKDGMSKEGSGRVAMLKATGITHSYTLECNYNTGRCMNSIAPACMDDGRATPPRVAGFPPKYTIAHFEEVGRALAVAALDFTDSNPWSRIASTEYNSVHGIRAWVQRYLRSMKGAPALPKKMSRVASRTSSFVATATIHHNLCVTTKARLVAGDTKAVAFGRSVSPRRSPKKMSKHLGPVRDTKTSIERKERIISNKPQFLSPSKSLPSQSVSVRSFDKPSIKQPHIPVSQRVKEQISLSLTHSTSERGSDEVGSSIPAVQRGKRAASGCRLVLADRGRLPNTSRSTTSGVGEDSRISAGLPSRPCSSMSIGPSLDQSKHPVSSGRNTPAVTDRHMRLSNNRIKSNSHLKEEEDPDMVHELLNHIVVKVLEQRTDRNIDASKSITLITKAAETSSPSAFKSFIQNKSPKHQPEIIRNKPSYKADANLAISLHKNQKKSPIVRRGANKRQTHPKRGPKMREPRKRTAPSMAEPSAEPVPPEIIDEVIQRRLLCSSMSDLSTGEVLRPQITYRSLDPLSTRRYSAPHTTPSPGAETIRSRSTSPMRTLSCQVVDLSTLTTKSQPVGPTKFTWNDL